MSNRRTLADHMPMGPGRHMMGGPAQAPKNKRKIVRWLWTYLVTYRLGLAGVTVLVALSTGLALLGPYLIGRAIDEGIAKGDLRALAVTAGMMLAVYVLSAAGSWAQSVAMIRISQSIVRDMRRDLFGHVQGLSLRFFDRHPHGELMSRLSNDTDLISNTLANSVTQLINSVLSVVGAGVMMFSMSWRLAAVSLVTLPLVLLVTRSLAARTREGFAMRQEALGKLNGIVEESIAGQRVTKACCRERESIDKFAVANVGLRDSAMKAVIVMGMMGPVMNLFRNTGLAVVAGAGGWMAAQGMITVGTVAAIINYSDYFNRPLYQLASIYGSIQAALAGADRVHEVLLEEPESEGGPEAVAMAEVRGEVEFDSVSFSYVEGTPVLTDVGFQVEPGQTVALVGSTGAGKTTIINLLTRFYDVDSGAIRVDGHDVRQVRRGSLRKALGIVLQDTFLFTGTVRENLRYGRLDATDEQIENAARLANAESFIKHLPHGYETILSDAGSNLSQGQRQLLAIARTLLADPAILILDEATSSVDTLTEVHIQQAMHRLMHGRTSFIIAHRLNTIQQADCIFVMAHGQIVERGTHAQLMEQHGAYHRLYGGA